MAWSPSKEVAVAREAARALGASRVVIIYTMGDEKIGVASYGQTKLLCAETGNLGDALYDATVQWWVENK